MPLASPCFSILEYVLLGIQNKFKYYPLEKLSIYFKENGSYVIDSNLVFEPPKFDNKLLHHIYNNNTSILNKVLAHKELNKGELEDLYNLPATYLICYLNGFESALEKLESLHPFLKKYGSKLYNAYKENLRILRKVKYN